MRRRPMANIAILLVVWLALASPAGAYAEERVPAAAERGAPVLDLAGEETTLRTAGNVSFPAYIVGPKRAPRGILLIPPRGGLTATARGAADRFAAAGYRAVIVDVGGGPAGTASSPSGPKQRFDQNDANAKYRAALEALRESGRRLAVMGWCFGAGQALEASLAAGDLLTATVMYGGAPKTDPLRLGELRSAVLLLQPASERARSLEAAMRQAGVKLEVQPADAPVRCAAETAETPLPESRAALEFLNRELGER